MIRRRRRHNSLTVNRPHSCNSGSCRLSNALTKDVYPASSSLSFPSKTITYLINNLSMKLINTTMLTPSSNYSRLSLHNYKTPANRVIVTTTWRTKASQLPSLNLKWSRKGKAVQKFKRKPQICPNRVFRVKITRNDYHSRIFENRHFEKTKQQENQVTTIHQCI